MQGYRVTAQGLTPVAASAIGYEPEQEFVDLVLVETEDLAEAPVCVVDVGAYALLTASEQADDAAVCNVVVWVGGEQPQAVLAAYARVAAAAQAAVALEAAHAS